LPDASKVGDYKPGIWLMAANGGRTENLISDGKSGVPSPDGTRIAFTSSDGSIIWVALVNGSNPRAIRSGGESSSFSSLTWSPDSKRLAYQRRDLAPVAGHQVRAQWTQLERSYQYNYESIDVETGRLAAEAKDFVMTSACTLPDGRVLFLRWYSPELVLVHQLWELRTDPGTGRILAPPRQLTHTKNNTGMSSLSASNDGKEIVAVRYNQGPPNIWIADLPPADQAPRLLNQRRLTFSLAEEFPHAWTADSRTIIFESNQNGPFDLYRQSIDRRESEPLVVSGVSKVLAEMSPDGRWLLYHETSQYRSLKVMRVPIEGGTPEPVLINKDSQGEFRCGIQPRARCVLRTVENDQFVFYELDPQGGRGRELARTGWSPAIVGDWALSPDGSRVAIPNHDLRDAKLRLVVLDREHAGVEEKIVTIGALKNLNGVVWAADGRGWFVSVRTDYGGLLTFVDLDGRVVNLLETAAPTYAVPSPDGRRVAFPEWSSVTNAWLFRGL
jgi:Tol biopolymer transport system component